MHDMTERELISAIGGGDHLLRLEIRNCDILSASRTFQRIHHLRIPSHHRFRPLPASQPPSLDIGEWESEPNWLDDVKMRCLCRAEGFV